MSSIILVPVLNVQAKAWLGWEFSVGSGRTNSLQVWNGKQWQQTDFPDRDSRHSPLPLATNVAASQPQTATAVPAAQPAAASTSQSGQPADAATATQTAQPAAMSAFTAQAMLECHYSHNGAFLQEPLIQVGALEQEMCSFTVTSLLNDCFESSSILSLLSSTLAARTQ